MTSLSKLFRLLGEMKTQGVVEEYALGGAMAILFYAEPTRTYDIDVFVIVPQDEGVILQLTPIYEWLRARYFHAQAEHVMIYGVPVQFLPVYNALTEEAVTEARLLDYEGTPVRVAAPEHLVAMCLQAGGRKRRERAYQLLEAGAVNRQGLRALLERHRLPTDTLDDEQ